MELNEQNWTFTKFYPEYNILQAVETLNSHKTFNSCFLLF